MFLLIFVWCGIFSHPSEIVSRRSQSTDGFNHCFFGHKLLLLCKQCTPQILPEQPGGKCAHVVHCAEAKPPTNFVQWLNGDEEINEEEDPKLTNQHQEWPRLIRRMMMATHTHNNVGKQNGNSCSNPIAQNSERVLGGIEWMISTLHCGMMPD